VHPSALFIRRPIATSLLMAAIGLFGIVAYRALPVSDLPNVDYPTLVVNAGLSGADPGTMASAVATPLERQFTMIAGLDEMTSSSSMGGSSVTMQFDLNRDIDSAAVDVQTAIAEVMPLLPPGMPSPPSFRKYNPADSPIMFLGLTSKTAPMSMLDDYAETLIAPRISMVSGVAQVTVWGSAKYAVRVRVDPNKLRAQQIGLDEVRDALSNWNVNLPTGTLYAPHASYSIRASGQLNNAAAFRPMVVAWRNGSPIRLDQVATVLDSVEQDKNDSFLYTKEAGNQRAINLAVMRQPGCNTIEVTDSIRRLLPQFQTQLPPSVHLTVRGDRSKNIRAAFKDIQVTMLLTLALVVGVIYLFLRNTSATMIPALALPFSIVGTFAVMQLMDFTLDNLSMMALILCVGFVVDDAIVMLENIVRHMEHGQAPYEAALAGSKEIAFTIVTMTLSLAAVFIPILFMGGILGRLFREFAITICTAILISGLVSITLTPMLASRFLRVSTGGSHTRLSRWIGRGFDALKVGYGRSLRLVLQHRPVMLGLFFAVLIGTVVMFRVVPKGFIPDQDNDSLNISIRAAQGTSYYQMVDYVRRVAAIVSQEPYVDSFMVNVGGGGGAINTARISVQLIPRAERALNVQQVIQRLRPRMSRFPGFNVFLTAPPAIQIGGRMASSTYTVSVQALDTDELYKWAPKLEAAVAELPIVQDVTSDMEMKTPRVNLVIDRDKAATMRLNATQIESALYDGFGPVWASTIYSPTAQYKVLLELDPQYQANADSLEKIAFKSSAGDLIPLQSIVRFKEDVGPQTINHSGQLPSVTVSFNLKPGVSLGSAVDQVQQLAKTVLPSTVTTSLQGSAKVFQASLTNLGLLLTVAILVVYIVLGILYESYVHPLTILSGLPSAGLGALLTLMLTGIDLNIYSFVGLIMLIGIVKKNAIMQIDFALEAERSEGKPPDEAIYEGCLIRFRPIMMTTMAALFGTVPIALGFGSGGEARRPLGIAVVGGLLVSQLMTLYLTPVVYTYMAGLFKGRGSRRRAARPATA
jgi:HAE1 family hydrophobic/amphiphilic exporter-1